MPDTKAYRDWLDIYANKISRSITCKFCEFFGQLECYITWKIPECPKCRFPIKKGTFVKYRGRDVSFKDWPIDIEFNKSEFLKAMDYKTDETDPKKMIHITTPRSSDSTIFDLWKASHGNLIDTDASKYVKPSVT